MLVRGRLVAPDAAHLSDRQLARELGLSQPFVSAQRRLALGVKNQSEAAEDPRHMDAGPTSPPIIQEDGYSEVIKESGEARSAIFTPVGLGRIGWVRRSSLHNFADDFPSMEWNPFEKS